MMNRLIVVLTMILISSCGDDLTVGSTDQSGIFNTDESTQAVVTQVRVSGEEGSYTFRVTLRSPDTGCEQYADWWEIFDEESELVYRRTFSNSHVNSQPFATDGGPVPISSDEKVYVRGHMNNLRYGSLVLAGSVESGFVRDTINAIGALERADPLPGACEF